MTPYQHGGDITTFAQRADCHPSEVIDLSSNINFIKPHISVDFNTLPISAYPNYESLTHTIATHYGVSTDSLELFNGASVGIFTLFRTLALSHSTLYTPAYLEYKKASQAFGYHLTMIDRFEALDSKVVEGSLVVFVNPSTPDGYYYPIKSMLEEWHAKGCTILIDESFLEFSSHRSLSRYLDRYERLYILKSMTKFFGSAGIRMGAILSSPANIASLQATEPLWKLSAFDSAYIQSALADSTFGSRSADAHAKSLAYLLPKLECSALIRRIYPSDANFLLIELASMRAEELQAHLLPHRIMVRDCSNFDGLTPYHVRIAIKSLHDLQHLIKALPHG